MRWDPGEYLRFADERGRPFRDLLARVPADDPSYVVDLGCGPGNLTRELASRWPGAQVEGVDSSPEMIQRARAGSGDGSVHFALGDVRDWTPPRPVDVLTCNATLQWVPGHLALMPRLVGMLAPGGSLAFQVPGNFGEPTHAELAALKRSPRWRERLAAERLAEPSSEEPATYLRALVGLGCRVDAWETTYLQVLAGDDAVLGWMRGTALRPVLSVLSEDERVEFEQDYGARLRAAYPREPFGTLLPYRRIFVVATRAPEEPS